MHAVVKYVDVRSAFRRFHENEGGMEALQTVAILAVAALALFGMNYISNTMSIGSESGGIQGWVQGLLGDLGGGIGGFISDLF